MQSQADGIIRVVGSRSCVCVTRAFHKRQMAPFENLAFSHYARGTENPPFYL